MPRSRPSRVFARLTDRFLPPMAAEAGVDVVRRMRLVVAFSYVLALCALTWALQAWLWLDIAWTALVLGGAAALSLMVPFWLRRWGSPTRPAVAILAIYMGTTTLMLTQGNGFQGPTLIWTPIVPLLGAFLLGMRGGLVAAAAVVLQLTVFFVLDARDYPFPDTLPASALAPSRYAAQVLLVLLVLGIAWLYEHQTIRQLLALNERARASEERYRTLVQAGTDMITVFDLDWRVTYQSPASIPVLGRHPHEIVGQPGLGLLHPDDATQGLTMLARALEADTSVTSSRPIRLRHADGSYRWLEAIATDCRGMAGVDGIVVNLRDVSERIAAEQETRRLKDFYESALEHLPVEIAVLDREGRHLFLNPAAVPDVEVREWLLGRTLIEYAERSPLTAEALRERSAQVERVMASGEPVEFDEPVDLADGSRRHYLRGLVPMRDRAGEVRTVFAYSVDMTDRIAIEEELRRSEASYRGLFGGMTEAITVVDPRGIIIDVNEQALESLGYGRHDVVGRPAASFGAEGRNCPDALAEHLAAALGGETRRFDWWGQRSDGSVFPQEVILKRGEHFGQTAVFATARDISDRKRYETALRRSNERFETISANLPGVIFQFLVYGDGRMTFPYLSPSAPRIFGVEPHEVRHDATAAFALVHEDDQEGLMRSIAKAAHERTAWRWEGRVHHGGEIRWIRGTSSPGSGPDGAVLFDGVLLDVTEERRAAERVKHSEESYRELFGAVRELIYILDLDGRFLDVNEAVVETYGYPRERFIGDTPAFLGAPGMNDLSAVVEQIQEAARGVPQRFDWWALRADGTIFPKEVNLTRARYFGQDVVIAVARDITERKQYEDDLVAARDRAQEMTRLKDAFLTNMSHEIRTPLTGILGFAQILATEVPDDLRELVAPIEQGGERLLQTLNSVLDLSRLEADDVKLHPEPFDLARELAAILRGYATVAADRNVRLHLEAPPEGISIVQDRGAVGRILGNVIDNSVKFTCEGRVHVRLTDAGDDLVAIEIADTGVGIDPAFAPRMFDAFEQQSQGLARDFEGAGLGLTIARELTGLLGGRIEVESTPGEGSLFTVVLPRTLMATEKRTAA